MKILAENRRVRFDFDLKEEFSAGIELTGHEVKSLKTKGGSLPGGHVIIRGGEAYLVGLDIPSFQPKNEPEGYEPDRTRRLLLNKNEITKLYNKTQEGLTIIPIKLYNNKRGIIKLDIALARGRKKEDKREHIKKRDADRDIRSAARRKK